MPRTVDPSRPTRRTAHACIPCRASKRRCNAEQPCEYCTKRKRASQCIYPDRVSHRSSEAEAGPSHAQSSQYIEASNPASSHPTTEAQTEYHTIADSPDTAISTHPRILQNEQGTQVFYVGSTATISFLQLLREISRQRLGPTNFTEYIRSNIILETETCNDPPPEPQEDLKSTQIEELIDMYLSATSGILDLVDASEVVPSSHPTHLGNNIISQKRSISDIVIAIGGRCHPNRAYYEVYYKSYFYNAKPKELIDVLEDVSVDTVRICLLTAFYFLCACRKNAAYMFIGMAARLAYGLGLHHEGSFRSTTAGEQGLHRRTWRSLRTLDVLVSTLLGRPPACSNSLLGFAGVNTNNDASAAGATAQIATYVLLQLMEEVVSRIYQNQAVNIAVAQSILERLTRWSTRLPIQSRDLIEGDPSARELTERQLALGNTNIACAYYFTVILTSRPFLIRHLLETAGRKSDSDTARLINIVILSQTCEDAAVYMLEMCHKSLIDGRLLINMPIMKAWVFAAALVVGFVMYVKEEPGPQIAKAFDNAMTVLQHFSQGSAQAEHYVAILSDFQVDLQKQRRKMTEKKRENSSRFVKKVFGPHSSQTIDENTSSSIPWLQLDPNFRTGLTPPPVQQEGSAQNPEQQFTSWDNLSLQIWDDFMPLDEYD